MTLKISFKVYLFRLIYVHGTANISKKNDASDNGISKLKSTKNIVLKYLTSLSVACPGGIEVRTTPLPIGSGKLYYNYYYCLLISMEYMECEIINLVKT